MSAQSLITEEDRRAAATVTTSGSGHRFEIQLGHLCNNRCVFCSSGQLTAMKIARPVPLEPIVEALEEARAAGANHLTFLGGEPTIHKRFLDALKKAVELGFEHIVIFTNGVMFTHPGFIESVTALGNFEWRISIQGATEAAHVATTERARSFERIVYGLVKLKQSNQLVTTNMCVNERSYRSLPHYPALLREHGVKQLHVDIVRPESTGERNEEYLRELMPRYSDMAPYYTKMLEGFEAWNPDFDVNVGNLPYCILPKWGSRIHHGGQETVTKSSDGAGLEDEMNKYEWQASLRRHLPACEDCVFRSRCTGIFKVYLEVHGEDEFQPISHDELLVLDEERRNFVLFAETWLAPLRSAIAEGQVPTGWSLTQEISEDRRRQVEMVFSHDSGGVVRLAFRRKPQSQLPILSAQDYDVEINVTSATPREIVDQILEWIEFRLSASPQSPTRVPGTLDLALNPSLLKRGRLRVSALGRKVRERFVAPGWHLEPLRWPSPTMGEVIARGPGQLEVATCFTVSTRNGRSHVGVDFKLPDAHDSEMQGEAIRSAVSSLVNALRSKPFTPSRSSSAQP